MKVEIKNCNNIDNGVISFEANNLNIKYGINGTGKTTIVKAIKAHVEGGDVSALSPFKYIAMQDEKFKPSVNIDETIQDVLVFDEEYLKTVVFKEDELIENSFEVFIETETYRKNILEIDKLVVGVKDIFSHNEDLDEVIANLESLAKMLGKLNKDGSISGASGVSKALKKGNPVRNVPKKLGSYTNFIQAEKALDWVDWQTKGNTFLDLSDECPYCVAPNLDKDFVKSVGEHYSKAQIKSLTELMGLINKLKEYFSEKTFQQLGQVVNTIDELEPADFHYLGAVSRDVSFLKDALKKLKSLSFDTFKEDPEVENNIKKLKIDLNKITHLNSKVLQSIVEGINSKLDEVLLSIGQLKGKVNSHKTYIRTLIEEHGADINGFLEDAGYPYKVVLEDIAKTYKLLLKPSSDLGKEIKNSSKHLSYGERNAFALILFMFQCLAKEPDLIILDDPVSSFDNHKKYALIDRLFRGKKSFRNKTVLMLTHDFEPIVDMLYTFYGDFHSCVKASFIENKSGVILEESIERDDIQSFAQISEDNCKNADEYVFKCIHLRRYFECLGQKGEVEYHILSNLLHKRPFEENGKDREGNIVIFDTGIDSGIDKIKKKLGSFSYEDCLVDFQDNSKMYDLYKRTTSNFEKLQLFRILCEGLKFDNKVLAKYMNETFHIENEYIMQLNPVRYNIVPEFIINACELVLNNLIDEKHLLVVEAA